MTARKILARHAAVTIEEEATFEVDPAAAPVRLRNVRNVKATLGLEMIPVDYQKSSDMRGPDPHVVGGKSGSVSFDVPLYCTTGSVSALLAIMKRMGMELVTTTGTAAGVTGGSADTIAMTDATAATAGLSAGAASIGKPVHHDSAAGTNSIRHAKRIVAATGTTTVTANQAFASTPVNGDGIQAMSAVKPKGGDPDKTFAICVYLGGDGTNVLKYQFTGCAGKWKFASVGPKQLAAISFEFQVSKWVDSEASITQPDVTGNRPMTMLGGIAMIGGVAVKVRNLGFDPAISLDEIESFDANGRQGWTHDFDPPVLEFQPLHDIDYITMWEAETVFGFQFQRILTDVNTFSLWVPRVQVIGYDLEEQGRLFHAKKQMLVCDPGLNADSLEIPPYVFAMGQ